MTKPDARQESLRRRLLDRLARLGAPPDTYGVVSHGAERGVKVFGYCVQVRERIARTRLEHPAVVVVLSGAKEIWRGDVAQRFGSGIVFVIPAGVDLDIVNIPDPRSGRFESLCITVDAEIRRLLRAHVKGLPDGSNSPGSLAIPLTGDLVEAYGHAARALSESGPAVAAAVARHRILEILLLLSETPHVARMLVAASRSERVEAMLQSDPARAWRAEEVARALGLGASTLRRHLKEAGTSFREILLSVRMATADTLLRSDCPVTQAAQAAGYRSRSHFARHFRAAHGVTPSRLRSAI